MSSIDVNSGVPVPVENNYKKKKEEQKKKQSGEIAPDLDENGKMINPHNPEFITKVPWYLGDSGPTLKHHSIQKNENFLSMTEADKIIAEKIIRQQELKSQSVKPVYRKGACKNCGSLTHKEKDCVERPRSTKKSAWKTGLDIAQDDITLILTDHGKVSYDAKRDNWQGYNPSNYQDVIVKFERIESERQKYKAELKEKARREEEEERRQQITREEDDANAAAKSKIKSSKISRRKGSSSSKSDARDKNAKVNISDKTTESESSKSSDSDTDSDSDYDSDEDDNENGEDDQKEFIAKDENARDFQSRMARQGGVGGNEMKITSRNLRIREDTSKYLRNLAIDSAFYDPKSRSMRSNPLPDENPEDLVYAGDNFLRYSGDAQKIAATQVLCWEMQAHGEEVDLISNPSQAELMQRQFLEKKAALEDSKKRAILEKYGRQGGDGVSASGTLDARLKLGQTEAYVEFSRDGRVIKGAPKVVVRTKYEEDVYINNHCSVWGSYFHKARRCWGYECCHSLVKNSYCTGLAGKIANDASNSQAIDGSQARRMLEKEVKKSSEANASSSAASMVKRSDIYGEVSGEVKLDEGKFKEAVAKEEAWQKRDAAVELDDRKRGYNSMKTSEVSMEDMEAYRLKKNKRDDPMANFMDSDI